MNVKKLSMLLLIVGMLLLVSPLGVQAASYPTCWYLNGDVMVPADVQQLTSLFGYLPCGSYWVESGYLWQMDNYGYWQRVSPIAQSTPTPWNPCDDVNLLAPDYIPPGC